MSNERVVFKSTEQARRRDRRRRFKAFGVGHRKVANLAAVARSLAAFDYEYDEVRL